MDPGFFILWLILMAILVSRLLATTRIDTRKCSYEDPLDIEGS